MGERVESKGPLKVPFVDLRAQYQALASEMQQVISAVLDRGDFILGEEVGLFEEEFAAYCEAAYAVGIDSGTAALELALRSFGIGPGDEVITSANTFIATVSAIADTGARPVLVDVDPETYNIDVSQMEGAITERTKGVIPVHLYGHPADMDPVLEIAQRYGLVVIEDACQAHGAKYKGKRVGSLAHAAVFSFYPAKNLGAYGDGGMVVTNDARVAEVVQMLRNHGQREKYHHILRGYNHRLDTLQAAVLRVKLKYLDTWNASRRQHAQLYGELLTDSPIVRPAEADYAEPVYHLYVVRVKDRDGLRAYLQDKGIATGIHYPIPVHLQPACRDLGYEKGSFPVTEEYAEQILSLPMYAELTHALMEYTAKAIWDFESKMKPTAFRLEQQRTVSYED
jgi:dTDP-4-amino-4,6-dideoxygalactose transaminase